MSASSVPVSRATTRRTFFGRNSRTLLGYVFILPWLISFLAFDLVPTVTAFALSLTDYPIVGQVHVVGLANYVQMFTADELYWTSLGNTIYYVLLSVPLGLVVAFVLALLLNRSIPGNTMFRTVYYLPAIVPTVAASIVWLWIFDTRRGILNEVIVLLGLPLVHWLSDPGTAKISLIVMSLWSTGGMMVIFLAGLQGVPRELYEAAAIDGANVAHQLRNVTLPLITPTLFFNLVMGLINSFQVFNVAFIMTGGGPHNATLFYMLHLYNKAFSDFAMGYASAMAVLLFLLVLGMTAIVFRTSGRWVYYAGGAE